MRLALGIGLLLLATACGNSPSSATASVNLQVSVRASTAATPRAAVLRCDPPSGSGWLSNSTAATAACTTVRKVANRKRLVDGSPKNRACTQIYGGPQVARVTGTIDGARADATITRSDGCGIADWESLHTLLGAPPNA